MQERLALEITANIQDIQGKLTAIENRIKNLEDLSSPFRQWTADLSHVYNAVLGFFALIQENPLAKLFKEGFRFSSQLEQSKISLAGILTSIANITNAQGKLLEGQAKFNESLKIAQGLQEELQKIALQTTASYEELVSIAQGIVAPFLTAGGDIKALPGFVGVMANAVKAMGLDLNQAVQEARDLLSGTIDINSQLARALGITSQMVKEWQAQGTLFTEIEARLQGFSLAGSELENSWAGIRARIEEAFTILATELAKPLFEKLKQDLKAVSDSLFVLKEGKLELREDFREKLQAIGQLVVQVYEIFKTLVSVLSVVIERFGGLIEIGLKIALVIKVVNMLTASLRALQMQAMATATAIAMTAQGGWVAGVVSKVGSAVKGFATTILQTISTLPIAGKLLELFKTAVAKLMPLLRTFFGSIGIVIATAITAYDIGGALWEWLDKATDGAITHVSQKILAWLHRLIIEIRGLLGKLKIPFLGISEEELRRQRETWKTINESIEQQRASYNKLRQTQETTQQEEAQVLSTRMQSVKKSLDALQEERKLTDLRMDTVRQIREEYVSIAKAIAETSDKLTELEKKSILIDLDFQLATQNYEEARRELLRKREELQSLVKLAPAEEKEEVQKELKSLNEEILNLDLDYYSKRVSLARSYIEELSRLYRSLSEELKRLQKETTQELGSLTKEQVELTRNIFKPIQELPTDIREKLANLLGINLGGFSDLQQKLSELGASFKNFFTELGKGAGIERLKELKEGFDRAKEGVLDFLKSLTPTQAIDLFRALGFERGFLPAREMLTQRVSAFFGIEETQAREMAMRLTDIFTTAQANIARAFRQMPELSQFLTPDQLLGMQLQRGLTDIFMEGLKQQTTAIAQAMQNAIQSQISQVENLMQKLQNIANIPIRLDLTQAETALEEFRKRASQPITIPVQTQQVGSFR